ncbi:hypothetical protein D0861_06259 [Hortaea werneckii]|uniref:C2H2-type domain-containing protein n=1 Tax=Hortaea werneckii TaxID=91943 RepID=A0A3M7FAF0_HORWE|nr:hypothetical protein D0861_06259 [Hortaea werneckii]
MSSPWTSFIGETTYDAGAWNDSPLGEEHYQRLYHQIMTSDVALNPTYTPTYPQEYASPAETLEICPSQANLGWDLNDTLQGVEKQKDFAHSGPSQVERPGLGEHSTESIVAGVGIPQDLDNTMRLPPECPLVPSLPPEYQNRQPDAGVRSDCTYAQALRDSCPAEAYSHHTVTPDIASFPQYPANTPSATRYGLTVPPASPLCASTLQGGRQQSNVPKLSLNTTGLLGILTTPQRPRSETSSPISASSSRSARRTPDQMRAWPAPFRCDNEGCGFGFETLHDLRPRRFICETCNKAFHYFKDLRRHWKIHNKDPKQKYHCPFTTCKHHCQGFNRDDHLRRHMEKQHQHVDFALRQSSGGLASV